MVVPYEQSRSPHAFAELLARQQVSVLNQTPSAFRQLLAEQESSGQAFALRLIIFGGEALDVGSVQRWWQRHPQGSPQLVNMYGITEATVHVTSHVLSASDVGASQGTVIGRGLSDLRLYVLDWHLQPGPPGVPGELYVGGAGLARGYLGQPTLTAERFVPHPWSPEPGSRLYKTGDVVRLRAEGLLEYLGRNDEQVKVRGFRIELGEIEAVLKSQQEVREALVVAREEAEGKRLVAYVVPREGGTLTVSQLREGVQARLPGYMLPAAFVLLEALPLTAHGKVDRRALPAPGAARLELREAYVPARTAQEEILVEIWQRVLGLERVGVNDNFFALGGDSIRSIRVLALAQERGLVCSLSQLFEQQTIAKLAQTLTTDTNSSVAAPPVSQPFSLLTREDRLRLPEDIEDAYPLTMLQAGMFFHSASAPESAVYHNVSSYHLQARFDFSYLRRALQQLLARHPVLRTSFDLGSFSQPLQLVHARVEAPLLCEDLRHLPPEEQDDAIARLLEEEKAHAFDWKQAPLLRMQVHRRSEESFQVTMTEHHAILDGWSVASLLTEFFEDYLALLDHEEAVSAPAPVALFRDFVALEQQALASREAADYWRRQLSESVRTSLPRRGRAAQTADLAQSALMEVALSAEVSQGLHQLARSARVPLKSVLLAAHLNVLRVLGGQADVLTGLVANGRLEAADGERVLGLFLNTLPFREHLEGGSWLELARQTFEIEQGLPPWRRYPLAQIQREQGGQPLFETIFNFTHFHVYQRLGELPRLRVLGGEGFARTNFALVANFSLALTVGQVQLQLECNDRQISAEQIKVIGGYYARTLAAMAAAPTARYEQQSLLSDQERQQVLFDWNASREEYPEHLCLHQLFEAQAQRTPDAIAVVFEDQLLTYSELNARANRLAHHLQASGVGPEVLIGICLERSLELLIGILAVLKAGGAYVPLDPGYPRERLAFMLQETRAPVLLTQQSLVGNLPENRSHVICLDADWKNIDLEDANNPVSDVCPKNLAYVIYTSGSTGLPKGVMVTHQGLVNYLHWCIEAYAIPRGGPSLVHSPLSFDLTVTSLFSPLLCGNYVCMHPRPGGAPGSERCAARRELVGTRQAYSRSPRLAGGPVAGATADPAYPEPHRGGRTAFRSGSSPWRESSPDTMIVNEYGPTEATVGCCVYQLPAGEWGSGAIPIGRPIANMQLYVLDHALQPVGMGIEGELFIGGVGVARGYINQPHLTAERFLPHPWSAIPGERLYRTGDRARYRQDGSLEFVGRQDNQVKLRGYRIEPGEIEAVLRQHPYVQDVVVTAREDALPGQKRLVAYLVIHPQQAISMSEIRAYLQERLPNYMIPSAFVEIEALPLTVNGKLDRAALPEPDGLPAAGGAARYVVPQTRLEQAIAAIWQAVLRVERVGVVDNFFDLGGHSLLLIPLQNRLNTALEENISLIDLFEYPTISALAQHIQQRRPPDAAVQEGFERAARRRSTVSRRRPSKLSSEEQSQEGMAHE